MNAAEEFEAIAARLACPAGRVCDCRHLPDGEYTGCAYCGCICPWPDPDPADGPDDPDACPCCGRWLDPMGGEDG